MPLLHAHHHVAVHLNKPAVGVVGKTAIAGGLRQTLHRLIVEAEIQDRVHHARHAVAGTRTHAQQQRIVHVAKLLAGLFFEHFDVGGDRFFEPLGKLLARVVVVDADLRCDRKAAGHRQADLGHLCQVGSLAAEQGLHRAVAVALLSAEEIDHPTRLGGLVYFLGRLFTSRLFAERGCHVRIEAFQSGNRCFCQTNAKKRAQAAEIYVRDGQASTSHCVPRVAWQSDLLQTTGAKQ